MYDDLFLPVKWFFLSLYYGLVRYVRFILFFVKE